MNVGDIISGFVMKIGDVFVSQFNNMQGSEAIIMEIALILILSTVLAFIARILRQPLIPAYVLTGLIIGPLALGLVKNIDLVKGLSEIGIAFLLFIAGLEISFKKIKEANLKKISIIGLFQILVIFGITILSANFLGLSLIQSVYLGIVLSFGSTMVVVKLYSDSGELITMHGRLVLGILLLQDLVAIIAIALFMSGGFSIIPVFIALVKLAILLVVAILLQNLILNRLFKFAAKSPELLLLSSLGVLFLFIILAFVSELSAVIGAFIAGVSLANSPFKIELESRISPLRDFFSILFFVALGMQVVFSGLAQRMNVFIFLIVGAIVVKPVITTSLLRLGGYRPKTSFLTGISLAQLSEFSLIIGMLGFSLGVLDQSLLSTIILATIITMALTTYLVKYKEKLYRISRRPLSIFKFIPIRENLEYTDKKDKKILLIGAHRMGSLILKDLVKKHRKEILVVDYNPEIINTLISRKVSAIYGDLGSPDLLEHACIDKIELVISTAPRLEDGEVLIEKIKKKNSSIRLVLTASRIDEALRLYELGADYVILPKVIAGEQMSSVVKKISDKNLNLKEHKKRHVQKLRKIHQVLY